MSSHYDMQSSNRSYLNQSIKSISPNEKSDTYLGVDTSQVSVI